MDLADFPSALDSLSFLAIVVSSLVEEADLGFDFVVAIMTDFPVN